MNTVASPDTAFVIVLATDDLHDRAYRFGKPLTYLSDRQHVRAVIVRSRVQEARAARHANTVTQLANAF
jgi:hypothetical protein